MSGNNYRNVKIVTSTLMPYGHVLLSILSTPALQQWR